MITLDDKLKCAQRELEMRERVYPRLIASRKMFATVANREIALMRAIVEDYEELARREILL